ncbi:MAG: hypothetical protein FJX64_04465 [Alphaproteobacteria bacterium]|nr:hypothetical protein [Alphaproteobacteria bacterium]
MSEPAAAAEPKIVAGRSCAGCTICCKLIQVRELDKPRLTWCTHCDKSQGCTIYATRPNGCRTFYCGWMMTPDLGQHWKPLHCKMVLTYEKAANRIAVHVDPGRLTAWREEPYYSDIKQWARHALANQGQVIVWAGNRVFAILPDRDKDLGAVQEGQHIVTRRREGPLGVEYDMVLLNLDDLPQDSTASPV